MSRTRVIVAAFALMTAHGPALAGPPPVLREVEVGGQVSTQVPRGGVVTVLGEALHECPPLPERVPGEPPPRQTCRHDEQSLSFGGAPVRLLLHCDRRRLIFIVPQETVPGRYALVVSIQGRGSAAIDIDVVEPPPAEDVDPPDPPVVLRIDRFERLGAAGQVQLEFAARTERLPDGASVEVSLLLHQRILDVRLVRVEGGVVRTTFGPYDRRLPAGAYSVVALFELAKQPGPRRRALEVTLDASERPYFERVERREFLQVGAFGELERQGREVQLHYRALLDDLDRLLRELDRWRAARVLARVRPPLGGPAPPAVDLVGFSRWLDVRLGPELERIRRTDAELDAGYAFSPEPRARAGLERLAAIVDAWGADLAARLGVRPVVAPSDAPTPSREELDSVWREALRSVGVKAPR